jgi:hypothetical protein
LIPAFDENRSRFHPRRPPISQASSGQAIDLEVKDANLIFKFRLAGFGG